MNDAIGFVDTPTLHLAFEEHGAPDGVPVVLLHGYPDDPRCYDETVPRLLARGRFRIVVPYLRGTGPT